MTRYEILHRTSYQYADPVIQSNHLLHLSPRAVDHQETLRHNLIIEPAPAWRSDRIDYFGNPMTLISLEDEHKQLSVNALSEIVVKEVAPPDFQATSPWHRVASDRVTLGAGLAQYTCPSPLIKVSPPLSEFTAEIFDSPDLPVLEGARRVMERIYTDFRFDDQTTDVTTPLEQVLEQRSGVCQDFAHLMIAALRLLGLPARYVSGYILTHPPEGQAKLEGSDASHAWVSVWAPETGWVDFDPTNNLVNSPEHIVIAYGRDFDDVSPIGGVLLGGGKHTVSVAVDVKPVVD